MKFTSSMNPAIISILHKLDKTAMMHISAVCHEVDTNRSYVASMRKSGWTGSSDTRDIATKRDQQHFADKCGDLLYWVATRDNGRISNCDSYAYKSAESMLMTAIRTAYPKLDEAGIKDVIHIWAECNEAISYCVEVHNRHEMEESAFRVEQWVMGLQDAKLDIQYGNVMNYAQLVEYTEANK